MIPGISRSTAPARSAAIVLPTVESEAAATIRIRRTVALGIAIDNVVVSIVWVSAQSCDGGLDLVAAAWLSDPVVAVLFVMTLVF